MRTLYKTIIFLYHCGFAKRVYNGEKLKQFNTNVYTSQYLVEINGDQR